MELISESEGKRPSRGVLICGDIAPFQSVVDGTVISGRRALREHNKRNNVTFTADFTNEWASKQKERERMYGGDQTFDRQRRLPHIIKAVDQHTRRK
jgi:hypothetical protein